MKRPIRLSTARSGRLAAAVPTITSSRPAQRCEHGRHAARRAVNRRRPLGGRRAGAGLSTAAGSSTTRSAAPRKVWTAGRGRSAGSSKPAGRSPSAPSTSRPSWFEDLALVDARAAKPRSRRTGPPAPAGATAGPRRRRGRARRARGRGGRSTRRPTAMWCWVRSSRCRSGPSRRSVDADGPAGSQIERPARLRRGQAAGFGLARSLGQAGQIDKRQTRHRRRALEGRAGPGPAAVHDREAGAQHLVPALDLGQAALQDVRPQPPLAADRRRQVVDRRPGVHLLQEPELLLAEGRGGTARRCAAGGTRAAGARGPSSAGACGSGGPACRGRCRRPSPACIGHGSLTAHLCQDLRQLLGVGLLHHPAADGDRQIGDGRGLENHAHRQLDAEEVTHAEDELTGFQRVPAEVEEAVVDADPARPRGGRSTARPASPRRGCAAAT